MSVLDMLLDECLDVVGAGRTDRARVELKALRSPLQDIADEAVRVCISRSISLMHDSHDITASNEAHKCGSAIGFNLAEKFGVQRPSTTIISTAIYLARAARGVEGK